MRTDNYVRFNNHIRYLYNAPLDFAIVMAVNQTINKYVVQYYTDKK